MTVNELEEKLNQANEKVTKRFNTIVKLCKKIGISSDDLIEKYHFTVNNNFEPYYLTKEQRKQIIENFTLNEDDAYEVTENLYKLYEVERVANNWEVKLQKEINKDNMEKIQVIWDFLTEWESKTIEWYKENSKKYFELSIKENEVLENYKNTQLEKDFEYRISYYKNPEQWRINYIKHNLENEFLQRYYSQIDSFTKQIIKFEYTYNQETYKTEKSGYKINEEVLTKVIAKEKRDKYFDLVERVTKLIGEIKDASHLSIGNQSGELNGIITGENGKVRIETISAGGYNIQRFHYRVLINRVKDSL